MTENPFSKAKRTSAKLRLGICGPSGSGKTYTSLLIALGLGGKIAVIDTEHGSANLYDTLGEYDVAPLQPPYKPERYAELMTAAEGAGYDVIILDSISHAWQGEGGLLDAHGDLTKRQGNSFAAWRDVTPRHTHFIDAMLKSQCHIIATMRSKTEYVQDKDSSGRTQIRKVGMAPVQREGMDYEFTVVLDLDTSHKAMASKDRTGLFAGNDVFQPTIDTGKTLSKWLEGV